MTNNPRNSPRFLKARNEQELEKKLLILAMQRSIHLEVTTIYPVKDGVVAWFYLDNDPFKMLKENELNGTGLPTIPRRRST